MITTRYGNIKQVCYRNRVLKAVNKQYLGKACHIMSIGGAHCLRMPNSVEFKLARAGNTIDIVECDSESFRALYRDLKSHGQVKHDSIGPVSFVIGNINGAIVRLFFTTSTNYLLIGFKCDVYILDYYRNSFIETDIKLLPLNKGNLVFLTSPESQRVKDSALIKRLRMGRKKHGLGLYAWLRSKLGEVSIDISKYANTDINPWAKDMYVATIKF